MTRLFIILPCYNEEETIDNTALVLKDKLTKLMKDRISSDSRICFVDDGSTDSTWERISKLNRDDFIYTGIRLSRNFGQQNCLLAGILSCKELCDVCITMDADLQDDVNAIDRMLDRFDEGCDIVYGVRDNRKSDSLLKRLSAACFYSTMKLFGVKQQAEHADFRLMSRRAINELEGFHEVNLFLRGIVPLIGLKSDVVYYTRQKRTAGRSKYKLKQMNQLAFEGISSFSTKPLKIIRLTGTLVFLISLVMLVWSIAGYFNGTTVAGWASLMVSIWGIGGLLMISIGVVGEYIGKTYIEVKSRPRYIVSEKLK